MTDLTAQFQRHHRNGATAQVRLFSDGYYQANCQPPPPEGGIVTSHVESGITDLPRAQARADKSSGCLCTAECGPWQRVN